MARRKVLFAVNAAFLNAVTVGIASTYSSTAIESMKSSYLKPDDTEVSWIGSSLPLGAIIGGIIAGYFSDKIGRKGVLMYMSTLLLAGWLLIAYATSLPFVYAGRSLTGICCGLICVVTPMYIVELSPPAIRGKLGSMFQMYICIGIIISATFGYFLPWEWVAVAGAAFAVLAPIFLLPMPESPRWLFMSGKHSEAVQAVKFLYGDSTDASLELITENSNTPSKSELSFREIFQPTVYKPALLSIALMFFQQFSGSNAVLYYTVSIFKQANSSVEPHMGNIFVAIIMFFFTLLSSCIMDSVGRKKCIFVSSLLMCLSLNAFSTYLYLSNQNPVLKETLGWIPLLCLLIYIASFSIGLGPIPWLMMPEMSPLRARGLICGLGTAFSWIFVFIITKSFLEIESLVYDFGAYWIYSCFCFMCCFFSIFLLPETKGKTFEEIESHFAGGQPRLQRLQEIPTNRPTDLEG